MSLDSDSVSGNVSTSSRALHSVIKFHEDQVPSSEEHQRVVGNSTVRVSGARHGDTRTEGMGTQTAL